MSVARTIARIGRKQHEKRRYIKAAYETGIVESGLKNLPGGDSDSQGWRQERASLYPNPRNVKASVKRFFSEAHQHDHGQPAGQLAADVQRPQAQYRGRYGQVSDQAVHIMRQYLNAYHGAGGGSGVGVGSSTRYGVKLGHKTVVDESAFKKASAGYVLGSLLHFSPDSPLYKAGLLSTTPPSKADFTSQRLTSKVTKRQIGTPGAPVARGKTAYVGDSLGVGTAPYLKSLIGKVKANVQEGRSSKSALHALRGMKGYKRVIFDAGTNDPNAKRFAKSIKKADRISGDRPVYVPIVHGPKAHQKNVAARKVAKGSKDVRLVRWHAPLSDGIHPGAAGYQRRALKLASVVQRDQPRGVSVDARGVPKGTRHLKGTANFEGHTVAAWIAPWLHYARKHGWKGQVNSGYRSYAEQAAIYASGVRPAAKPGTSNHEGKDFPRGAVDVSEAEQLARILRRAGAPLRWAGGKDPVHFSHPHNGSY
jgi:hypothetical protein